VPALAGHWSVWAAGELRPKACKRRAYESYEPLAGHLGFAPKGPPIIAMRRTGAVARWLPELARKNKAAYLAAKTHSIRKLVRLLERRLGRQEADLPDPSAVGIVEGYAAALAHLERAYDASDERLEGRIPPGRYRSAGAEDWLPRTYLVAASAGAGDLGSALREAAADPRAEVWTEKALKFVILSIRSPEVWPMLRLNPALDLGSPSRRALTRHWRWCSQPRFFRAPLPSSPDPASMCRLAAAARLYLDRAEVTSSAAELRRVYRRVWGSWPFEETNDLRGFYEREYSRLQDVAGRVIELLNGSREGMLEDYP
jgi:hypothetical protein